jgi:hypothetical protein
VLATFWAIFSQTHLVTLLGSTKAKACFQTKNPNLGKFWRVLLWKILVYFITIWTILWLLEIFYGHLVYLVVIWYIFPRFGILEQEKSGICRYLFKTVCIWSQFYDRELQCQVYIILQLNE